MHSIQFSAVSARAPGTWFSIRQKRIQRPATNYDESLGNMPIFVAANSAPLRRSKESIQNVWSNFLIFHADNIVLTSAIHYSKVEPWFRYSLSVELEVKWLREFPSLTRKNYTSPGGLWDIEKSCTLPRYPYTCSNTFRIKMLIQSFAISFISREVIQNLGNKATRGRRGSPAKIKAKRERSDAYRCILVSKAGAQICGEIFAKEEKKETRITFDISRN